MTRSSAAAGSSPRLSRERIVAAVVDLLESGGVDAVTTRTVGEALQVHPTALYRHFRDMDDLIREVAPAYFTTGEQAEGADAFLQKRKPDFSPFR